ncbi:MAG: hypothetical protein AAF743_13065, partial [Planctomycetota bacterium]
DDDDLDDEFGVYDFGDDDDDIPALAGKKRHCGGCQVELPADAVVCVTCGMDFRTGRKVGAAKLPTAPTSMPAPTSRAPKQRQSNGEAADILKKLALLGVVAMLVVGAFIGIKHFAAGEDLSNLHPEDQLAREKMNDNTPAEAREWLAASKRRMLSGMTQSQAEYKIDQWYDMGAETVYSFGGLMSMVVVLELPDDPDKRKALFDWRERWYAEMMEIAHPDEGQEFMVVQLRL